MSDDELKMNDDDLAKTCQNLRTLAEDSVMPDTLRIAADEIERLQSYLQDLLAMIHVDGGHHTEEVGLERSVEDARDVWAKAVEEVEVERTEAEIERLRTLEQAAIEVVATTDTVVRELGGIEGRIPKGSPTDVACDRHNEAEKRFRKLAKQAASAAGRK